MKIKRVSVAQLLNNNKIAFVISVVLAISLWAVVAVFFSEQQENIISDIPINIEVEEISDKLGLQSFGKTDYTVSVKVSGKRYEVSSAVLSKEDFIATASTANVSSAGKYSLPVSVELANPRSGIDIVSWSSYSVDVFFDYMLSESYAIEPVITADSKVAADGFIQGEPLMSVSTVTISGAATEIEKIHKVIAKVNIDEPLTQTGVFPTAILPINENNGSVRSAYINIDGGVNETSITVPILKETKITPTVKFKNTPSYFINTPINYICTPSNDINAAVAAELVDSTKNLSIGSVDFSQIKPGMNRFSFKTDSIPNVRVLDEIDVIDVAFYIGDDFGEKMLTVNSDNLMLNGITEDVPLTVQEDFELNIKVIGLTEELEGITAQNIKVSADVSEITEGSGETQVPLTFTVENTTGTWVYGTYTVKITA